MLCTQCVFCITISRTFQIMLSCKTLLADHTLLPGDEQGSLGFLCGCVCIERRRHPSTTARKRDCETASNTGGFRDLFCVGRNRIFIIICNFFILSFLSLFLLLGLALFCLTPSHMHVTENIHATYVAVHRCCKLRHHR